MSSQPVIDEPVMNAGDSDMIETCNVKPATTTNPVAIPSQVRDRHGIHLNCAIFELASDIFFREESTAAQVLEFFLYIHELYSTPSFAEHRILAATMFEGEMDVCRSIVSNESILEAARLARLHSLIFCEALSTEHSVSAPHVLECCMTVVFPQMRMAAEKTRKGVRPELYDALIQVLAQAKASFENSKATGNPIETFVGMHI